MDTFLPAVTARTASDRPIRLSRLGDEVLARLAGGGGKRAFAVLYERYHQPLYRYCRSILRDDADAQDALQSTFAAALGALHRGRRDAPLRPWLFRIAHNESISLLRRRRAAPAAAELIAAQARSSAAPSAAERAGERARLELLVADLADVPPRARSALLMRELNGLGHEEIAIALGTSVGAAKQAIFDARRCLSELAEGRAMACEEIQRTISDGDRRALRGRRVRAHLRDCGSCAAFATAIPARRSDLLALAPLLPPAASAAVLAHAVHATVSGGAVAGTAGTGAGAGAGGAGVGACGAGAGGAGAGGAGAAVGVVGKTVAATIASKALVAAAVVATAATAVGGIAAVRQLASSRPVGRAVPNLREPSPVPAGSGHRVAGAAAVVGSPKALSHRHAGGVSSRTGLGVPPGSAGRRTSGAHAHGHAGLGSTLAVGPRSAGNGQGSANAAPTALRAHGTTHRQASRGGIGKARHRTAPSARGLGTSRRGTAKRSTAGAATSHTTGAHQSGKSVAGAKPGANPRVATR